MRKNYLVYRVFMNPLVLGFRGDICLSLSLCLIYVIVSFSFYFTVAGKRHTAFWNIENILKGSVLAGLDLSLKFGC